MCPKAQDRRADTSEPPIGAPGACSHRAAGVKPISECSAYCQEDSAPEDVVGRETIEIAGPEADLQGQEPRILVQHVVHGQAQVNISGHRPNGTQIEITIVGYVRQVRIVKPLFAASELRTAANASKFKPAVGRLVSAP